MTTADGFRALADFLDKHPELTPSCPSVHVFPDTREELAEIARSAGPWVKTWTEDWYNLEKNWGDVQMRVCIERPKVCERIVTKKTVVRPIMREVGEEEVEVEEVTYECPESLLR